MALIDNTYTLEAGTVYEFSNVVGIQKETFKKAVTAAGVKQTELWLKYA